MTMGHTTHIKPSHKSFNILPLCHFTVIVIASVRNVFSRQETPPDVSSEKGSDLSRSEK